MADLQIFAVGSAGGSELDELATTWIARERQQPAKNGPEPGPDRFDRRRRPPRMNAETASRNLIAAGFFVIRDLLLAA